MRLSARALALVLLILGAFASTVFAECEVPTGGSLTDAVKSYLRDGETFETRAISTGFGEYTLVSINGREAMLFSDASNRPVTDQALIYSVLKSEYLAENKIAVDSQKLIENIDLFNSSRNPQQATCEQYTGTGTHECNDFATCRYACLSVPLCRGTFEGQGDNFIYAINSWRTKSSEMDKAIIGFRDTAAGIHENPELAGSAGSYLTAIEEKATDISANKLFTCVSGGFCFCYPINFSFAILNENKNGLSQINDVLAKLPDLEKKSNVIYGVTEERILVVIRNNVLCQYQETAAKVIANRTGTKEYAGKALLLVKSDSLSQKIASLENISSRMIQLGDEKNYTGALSLSDSYFNTAKAASLYAEHLIENYSRMNDSLSSVKIKLEMGINLTSIGDYYTKEYTSIRLGIEGVFVLAKPPVLEQALPEMEQNLTTLDSRLGNLMQSGKVALAYIERAELAKTNFTRLSKSSEDYKQNYNLSEINESITSAIKGAKGAQFLQAEAGLSAAYEKTAAYEKALFEIIPEIEGAKEEYGKAIVYLDERKKSSFIFFGVDAKRAEGLCKSASDSIYPSPRDSVQFSNECRSAIDSELQGLEYKKYGLVIVLIIALYLFYKWARKREWGFVVG